MRWTLLPLALLVLAGVAAGAPTVTVTSSRQGNVFVAGETPELAISVTADEAFRGRLAVVAADGYRRVVGRGRFAVDLAPGETQTFQMLLRPRGLGHIAVLGSLRAGRGPRIAVESSAAIVPSVDGSDAEASSVGYYFVPGPNEATRAPEIAEQMRRVGIRWVRFWFQWNEDRRRFRPNTNLPTWLNTATYETWVDAFRANGIEVMGMLFGTARWASSVPNADNISDFAHLPRWALVPPADMADWTLMVTTLAERLRGRVRSWEVWNEPDLPGFFNAPVEDFITLAHATVDAVRAVDPTSRVIVNLVDVMSPEGQAFFETVLTQMGTRLDVFGLHYGTRDNIELLHAARPMLRPDVTFWNTEAYGVPRRHVSRFLQQRADGIERIFPFVYHLPVSDAQIEIARFGIYPVNLDYTPRPDAIALRTMSDVVGSAPPVATAPAGLGYAAHAFDTDAGPVVALVDGNEAGLTWSGPPGVDLWLELPASVARVDVIDLMGNTTSKRVRKGRLKLRLHGVAAFLRAAPGAPFTSVTVTRARAARR